jgi:hypothetical protein
MIGNFTTETCRIDIYLQVIHKAVLIITATRVSVGKRYHYPLPIVWDIVTDTDKWPPWGPTVKEVRLPELFIRNRLTGKGGFNG